MALVLIRELNGNGNFDTKTWRLCQSTAVKDGVGRTHMRRTGGDAWQPEFGKGSLLVFRPWEAVVCPSGRPQEDAVLAHVHGVWPTDPPVVRLDFTGRENPEIMREYLIRHPDLMPKGDPGSADFVIGMMRLVDTFNGKVVPDGRPSFVPMNTGASAAELDALAKAMVAQGERAGTSGRRLGASGGEASIAKGNAVLAAKAERDAAEAEAIYAQKVAEHIAKGASPEQAATYAGRSKAAFLRRAEAGQAPEATP